MKKQQLVNSEGSISLDPSKMSYSDIIEGAYMLQATGTLLRQAFGIVCMTNSLQDNPMSDAELKAFGQNFDLVHKTVNVMGKALFEYAKNLPKDV